MDNDLCRSTHTEDLKEYTKFVIRKYELRCLVWRSRYRWNGKINISVKQNWKLWASNSDSSDGFL